MDNQEEEEELSIFVVIQLSVNLIATQKDVSHREETVSSVGNYHDFCAAVRDRSGCRLWLARRSNMDVSIEQYICI